jgi:hypothetical protein
VRGQQRNPKILGANMSETTEHLKGTVSFDITSVLALTTRSEDALANAKDFVIDTDTMLELAAEDLRAIKALQKSVEEERVSKVKPMNDEVKTINERYKAPLNFLSQAESVLKSAIGSYQQKQLLIAQEAQRQADQAAAEARRKLEQEQRQQREEAARLEREATELANQAAKAAASGNESAAAEARKQAQRLAELAQATSEQADESAATAEVLSFAPAVAAPAKVSGISGRITYGAEVTSLIDLVKAVADGKAPLEAVSANTTFLGQQARAFKKAGPLYPGVTAIATHGISARAA